MRYRWTTAERPAYPYEGQAGYNSTDGVHEWYDGTRWVQADQMVRIHVKNTSGGTLTASTPVYATGSVGASGEIEVAAADAANSAKMPALGLLEDTLANNGEGEVVAIGNLFHVDTSAYAINGVVYVASGGGLTPTRPTGSTTLVQNIGRVIRVHATTGIVTVLGPGRSNDVPNLIGTGYLATSGTASSTTFLRGDQTWATPTASATPGGSNTEVQYNDSGSLAGDSEHTWNKTTKTLTSRVLTLGSAGSTLGQLRLSGNTSGVVTVKPAATAGTWSLTLPASAGSASAFLQTDGSGVTSWAAAVTGPGGSANQIQWNSSGAFAGSSTLTYDDLNGRVSTTEVQLGVAGTAGGKVMLDGSTSGKVTVQPAAAAGTWSLTLPTTGGSSGQYLQTDGTGVATWAAGTVPGGSNTQVQFNDSSAFGGDSGLTYNKTTDTLSTKVLALGSPGTSAGSMTISGSSSGTITVQGAASAGTYSLTLPTTDGNSDEVLRTDGSGVLSWVSRDLWTTVKLSSNFTTTAATQQNVTGLTFTPAASTDYEFYALLLLESSASGVAVRPGLTWPSNYTDGAANIFGAAQAVTVGTTGVSVTGNTAGTALASLETTWSTSTNVPYLARVDGYIRAGASTSGAIQITVCSETNGTTVRVKNGSFLRYRTVS